MEKRELISLLEKERDYEENIIYDLSNLYLYSLQHIEDLNEEEIEQIKKDITCLRDDSENHKKTFEKLIDYVRKKEKNIW
jgi:flagellar biosynthesis chaperone FliJ